MLQDPSACSGWVFKAWEEDTEAAPRLWAAASVVTRDVCGKLGLLVRGDGWWPHWRPRRGFWAAAQRARAPQHTPSPSKAGVPVLLAPSARCAHRGSGSEASTRSRCRGAHPQPAPQPRSQPRRLLSAEPHKPLKTCPGTFQHSEPGRRESTSVASTGLSPSSAGGGSPSRQLAGALRGVRAQKERDQHAETAADPQAGPAPHRPLGRTPRRSLPDPLPTQASEQAPAPPHVKLALPAAATRSQTHVTLTQSPGKPTAGETPRTYRRRDSRGCALRRT